MRQKQIKNKAFKIQEMCVSFSIAVFIKENFNQKQQNMKMRSTRTASSSHPQLHHGSALEELQTLRFFPVHLAAL